MKFLKILIFSLLFLCVWFSSVNAQQVTITAGSRWEDALINSRSGYENTNYGNTSVIQANAWTAGGSPFKQRNLIYTNLTGIPPGSTITNATLYLYTDPSWTGHVNSTLSQFNDFTPNKQLTEK